MNRWQFSTRSLFVLTAVVSLVLAFAVRWPTVFQVMLIIAALVLLLAAILQATNFAASDRRPQFSVLWWILLSAYLGQCAALKLRLMIQPGGDRDNDLLIDSGIMAACCLYCGYRAYRSYLLIGQSTTATGSEPERASTLARPIERR